MPEAPPVRFAGVSRTATSGVRPGPCLRGTWLADAEPSRKRAESARPYRYRVQRPLHAQSRLRRLHLRQLHSLSQIHFRW